MTKKTLKLRNPKVNLRVDLIKKHNADQFQEYVNSIFQQKLRMHGAGKSTFALERNCGNDLL